jgi:hypothetical protein
LAFQLQKNHITTDTCAHTKQHLTYNFSLHTILCISVLEFNTRVEFAYKVFRSVCVGKLLEASCLFFSNVLSEVNGKTVMKASIHVLAFYRIKTCCLDHFSCNISRVLPNSVTLVAI